MLGGLGSDRAFSALCHNINFMSRQDLGMGQDVWVGIRVPLCHDKVFPKGRSLCCDKGSFVTIELAR